MTQPTADTIGRCDITACGRAAVELVPAYNPPHLQPVPDTPMCAHHAALAHEGKAQRAADTTEVCRMCEQIGSGFGPSHDGSPRCESGSIASGGTHAHCTCDTCF